MTDICSAILEVVSSVRGDLAEPLSVETRIDSLELDSLDEVEILMEIEDRFGIEIDQALVNGCQTLGDLIALVDRMRIPIDR